MDEVLFLFLILNINLRYKNYYNCPSGCDIFVGQPSTEWTRYKSFA